MSARLGARKVPNAYLMRTLVCTELPKWSSSEGGLDDRRYIVRNATDRGMAREFIPPSYHPLLAQ